jgi:hypothetical protein
VQVIATEDFPLLPKMQKKFAESAHAKVGFGLVALLSLALHHCSHTHTRLGILCQIH